MPEQSPVFHIMSVGWEYPGWTGKFYPDDLPVEWRLAYYANEFPGVLIPHQRWITAGSQTLESWVADVSESFRFYLEVNQVGAALEWRNKARCLGGNFGGLVVDQWQRVDISMDNYFQRGLANGFALVEMPIAGSGLNTHLPKGVGIAFRIPTEQLTDLMSQRRLLEQLARDVAPVAEVLLFLDGDPPAIKKIHEFKVLTELLGLA
jgi:hypothetical protein